MNAKRTRPRQQKKQLRERARDLYREAILEAAEQVFADRGFAGTRMADVAKAAGIATGTLYNYFDNKQAVLCSLLDHLSEVFQVRLQAVYDDNTDPLERITALVHASYELIESHRAMPAIMQEFGAVSEAHLSRIGGEVGEVMEQCYAVYVARYDVAITAAVRAGRLRKDIPAVDLTAFLTGAMNGFLRAWILSGYTRSLSASARTVMELFLAGARKKP